MRDTAWMRTNGPWRMMPEVAVPIQTRDDLTPCSEPFPAAPQDGSRELEVMGGRRRRHEVASPRDGLHLVDAIEAVADPIVLTTRAGYRYRLVAASPTVGVFEPLAGAPKFTCHTRFALTPEDGHLGSVRAVVQVVERKVALVEGTLCCAVWLAVTATGRRSYLREALSRMLSIDLPDTGAEDRLDTCRKLVYNPNRRAVSLVSIGAEALPHSRGPRAPADRPIRRQDAPAMTRGGKPHNPTEAFVLVADAGARRRPMTGDDVAPWSDPKAHGLGVSPPSVQRVPTDRLKAAHPMVRVDGSRGCFTADGRLRGMTCERVGHSHLVFRTTRSASQGLVEGEMLSLGIVKPPDNANLVWVVGEVVRMAPDADRMIVEVDLRRAGEVPRIYDALVRYWTARA